MNELDALLAAADEATSIANTKPIVALYAKDSSGKNVPTDIPFSSIIGTKVSILKGDESSTNCTFTAKQAEVFSKLAQMSGEATIFRIFIKG